MVCVKIISDGYLKIVGRFKVFKPAALNRWKQEPWILRSEGLPKGLTREEFGEQKTAAYLARKAVYSSAEGKNARHSIRNRNWRAKQKEKK